MRLNNNYQHIFYLTLYRLNSFFYNFSGQPKIGSFRLPTHSRNAHRNFLVDPFFKIKIKILAKRTICRTFGSKGLMRLNIK